MVAVFVSGECTPRCEDGYYYEDDSCHLDCSEYGYVEYEGECVCDTGYYLNEHGNCEDHDGMCLCSVYMCVSCACSCMLCFCVRVVS